MITGKANIVTGLWFLAGFMLYGFFLIYLRDFAPGREDWIAQYSTGVHFESRLAHVHGNLFALLNVLIGYLILRLPISAGQAKLASWLGLAGMLMPVGILAEVLFGVPPYLVIVGGVSIVAAMVVLGLAIWRADLSK
ncbi:hypothetical protein [Pararhodobacter sp.]|uniref:hypothetical protein n=1 Tax=Pararhodobacter sp. TaxID=2127056 RepID=UPI002AFE7E8E|nr:hypothetical protein [Pararhodobacter sp.]